MRLEQDSADYANLGEPGKKLVNEAVDASLNSASLADQYETLADEIDANITDRGVSADVNERIKRAFGTEDEPSKLRLEFQRLRNSAVLGMLPPGVASDKDIEIANAAFPEPTANPELISDFLRSMARLQAYDAVLNRNRSEWVQRVGSLGDTKQDIVIGGQEIPAGTSFIDYSTEMISSSPQIAEEPALEETETVDIDALLEKYGGT